MIGSMPDLSEPPAPTATLSWVAVSDVVIGLVVLLVGLAQDSTPMAVGGGVLLLAGLGVLGVASAARNRPTRR